MNSTTTHFSLLLILILVVSIENKFLPRIVGGQNATLHEFPFAALITDLQGLVVCGGTLISPQYVLTAAHCVRNKIPSHLIIRLGEHDLHSENETRHVSVSVEEITAHPNFNYFQTNNDIALLRLHRALTPSQSIRSICLPSDESFDGETATVIGWGYQDPSGTPSSVLKKLQVQILNKTDCKERLGTDRWWLTNTKICAWSYNQNACEGDSGGPLVRNDGNSVIGVVSFGVNCGTTNIPSIYTRISKYNEWILNNTKSHLPCIYQKSE